MCTLSISNVIYHKFSHGAAFYTLNGKNVNVMLEFCISLSKCTVHKDISTLPSKLQLNSLSIEHSKVRSITCANLPQNGQHVQV